MQLVELQNRIIRIVLDTNDEMLLKTLDSILEQKRINSSYVLSGVELRLIEERLSQYAAGDSLSNDDVEKDIDQWLNTKTLEVSS